jgi:hypothetical protein
MTRWRQVDFEGLMRCVRRVVRPGSEPETIKNFRDAPDDPYLMTVVAMDKVDGGEIRVGYALEPVPDRLGAYQPTFYVREDPF